MDTRTKRTIAETATVGICAVVISLAVTASPIQLPQKMMGYGVAVLYAVLCLMWQKECRARERSNTGA